ncbi:hypothetical protein [Streptomyces cacaoi]
MLRRKPATATSAAAANQASWTARWPGTGLLENPAAVLACIAP